MIGIVGGMGPLATKRFYEIIIEKKHAERDQDNIDMIILSHSSMPDRTQAILSESFSDVEDKLIKDCLFLQNSGCDAIGITCNTAHFFAERIEDKIEIPIINMLRITVEKLADSFGRNSKIGIMATDGTIKTKIYQDKIEKAGMEVYLPSASTQRHVMSIIYDYVKAGDEVPDHLIAKAVGEFKSNKCDCVIMGCTELSVLKSQKNMGEFYVDPMEILAEELLIEDEKYGSKKFNF